ncbi:MAG: TetR family transcriptional regulator, partial [Paenibacillus sp.]|nr:TetR family transcriptional regulator [Paenibacillus sp.]
YVSSKDELFGLVLRERLNTVNDRFFDAVKSSGGSLIEPLKAITESMEQLLDEKEVTNRILVYLLSQRDNPVVEQMLAEFDDKSISMSVKWIKTGQSSGVIPATVDAEKFGELFVLISYGMRVRGMAAVKPGSFKTEDMFSLMKVMLGG